MRTGEERGTYIVLEQHKDGTWYYHPNKWFTADNREGAEKIVKESQIFKEGRPYRILHIREPFPTLKVYCSWRNVGGNVFKTLDETTTFEINLID